MSVTVDANVLVYASNEADPAHGVARALVERLAAGPDLVYLFWPTIMGYLRIDHPPCDLAFTARLPGSQRERRGTAWGASRASARGG